jgi:DNA-binding beta-propeller fold protein YncE
VLVAAGCRGAGPAVAPPVTTASQLLTGTALSPSTAAGAPATSADATSPPPPAPTLPVPHSGNGNVYAEATAEGVSPAAVADPPAVYVPSDTKGSVTVIDPLSLRVVLDYHVGKLVQHVVPAWGLGRLYAAASGSNALFPIDPVTGKPGRPIPVDAPYNLYFTPDGAHAVVMAERLDRIDYYDPTTWARTRSTLVPCHGVNHADWSFDGRWYLVTCEFSGQILKVDSSTGAITQELDLPPGSMPQDVRLGPDGRRFYVADMAADGVWVVDGDRLTTMGFIATGVGAHGIYPSRDGHLLYVSNRGRHMGDETRRSRPGEGSVSAIDAATGTVVSTWAIPGGGSPDMGGLTADGGQLWLSGRYDSEVYVFATADGHLLARIPVPAGPHGLCVWPQPGRYSLGHTGNTR